MQTEILDPLSYENWDAMLAEDLDVTIFHSRSWAKVLFETYRYRPAYFCTLHQNSIKSLTPLMEVKSIWTGRRGVSLPFTDACEPVFNKGVNFDQLLSEIYCYGHQHHWQWVQLRGGEGMDAEPQQQFYLHELALDKDLEKLIAKFRPAKRRNIRKAESQQVQIEFHDDADSMDIYYKLHCKTRKRHGVPPQPYRFFKNIHKHLISQGFGKLLLARYQQQVIAANVFFHFRKKAIYKFGASDRAFQQVRANDLVMWEAMKWYALNGYESFSFGRTSPENTGLRRFKSDWGAAEEKVNYYRYDLRKKEYVSSDPAEGSACQRMFQMMPEPALKWLGSVLYKHMG